MGEADVLLYSAKQSGRNAVAFRDDDTGFVRLAGAAPRGGRSPAGARADGAAAGRRLNGVDGASPRRRHTPLCALRAPIPRPHTPPGSCDDPTRCVTAMGIPLHAPATALRRLRRPGGRDDPSPPCSCDGRRRWRGRRSIPGPAPPVRPRPPRVESSDEFLVRHGLPDAPGPPSGWIRKARTTWPAVPPTCWWSARDGPQHWDDRPLSVTRGRRRGRTPGSAVRPPTGAERIRVSRRTRHRTERVPLPRAAGGGPASVPGGRRAQDQRLGRLRSVRDPRTARVWRRAGPGRSSRRASRGRQRRPSGDGSPQRRPATSEHRPPRTGPGRRQDGSSRSEVGPADRRPAQCPASRQCRAERPATAHRGADAGPPAGRPGRRAPARPRKCRPGRAGPGRDRHAPPSSTSRGHPHRTRRPGSTSRGHRARTSPTFLGQPAASGR